MHTLFARIPLLIGVALAGLATAIGGCGSSADNVTYTADNAPVVYRAVPDDASVYTSEEANEVPDIDGDTEALIREIDYPSVDYDADVEGVVLVSFIVGPDGLVYEPDIVESVSPGLDREAMRVLQQVDWTPGRYRGEPAYVAMELPVPFRLADHTPSQERPGVEPPSQSQPQPPRPPR
ncbi:MAG: energy transducer TonB [Longimonas sp.]|uniref:energy transducer TonB n=1 Tax=Longimonas sp. TaxID=2039626 RepID=UPI003355874C